LSARSVKPAILIEPVWRLTAGSQGPAGSRRCV